MKVPFAAKVTFAAISLVAAGLALATRDSWTGLREIREESRRLDDDAARIGRFHATVGRAEEELLKGATTLDDAASTVLGVARDNNPEFVQRVADKAPGGTAHEKMMHVLLGRLQARDEVGLLSTEQKEHLDSLRKGQESD